MYGFGNLKNIEQLKNFTGNIQEKDLINDNLTPEQEARLENIVVPMLENDEWKPKKNVNSSGSASEKVKVIGAAGNSEKSSDAKSKSPILGGMGMGGMSIKPEFKKQGLSENFVKNASIDEDPQKEAKERTKHSMVVNKVKEMFDEMFGSKFGKQKEFDFDATKDTGTKVSDKPFNASRRIPRGW